MIRAKVFQLHVASILSLAPDIPDGAGNGLKINLRRLRSGLSHHPINLPAGVVHVLERIGNRLGLLGFIRPSLPLFELAKHFIQRDVPMILAAGFLDSRGYC